MDTMGKLDILGHYCNMLSVDCGKVSILQVAASCRARTTCTWKHRSYLPISWAILQTRCKKGHLCMRSKVLFLNQQITWRATIPSQYFWGLFNIPAFKNFFQWALPPTFGQSLFWADSSPTVIDGPASTAICTSCLVGDDPGDCPTSSSFLTSSLHLSTPPGVGGHLVSFGLPVPELLAVLGPLFLIGCIALPTHL